MRIPFSHRELLEFLLTYRGTGLSLADFFLPISFQVAAYLAIVGLIVGLSYCFVPFAPALGLLTIFLLGLFFGDWSRSHLIRQRIIRTWPFLADLIRRDEVEHLGVLHQIQVKPKVVSFDPGLKEEIEREM
ncbi:MAG: hypothetical protein IT428_12715 [Planctomycetaceae bacterium]|nr:hypothetical protein [Planctomycetaceae bacterium]